MMSCIAGKWVAQTVVRAKIKDAPNPPEIELEETPTQFPIRNTHCNPFAMRVLQDD